jgi:Putative DNA-binding domain
VQRLIDEGETLFVERKERDPRDGLGATVASFANTLGGWLVIGVANDGSVVGYEPKGRADLQDYIRDVLQTQVDPVPPFAAHTVTHQGKPVGIVRVAESSDTPHVAGGVIYQRTHGGKQRVSEARDVIALARRGDQAHDAAERRLYALPLVADAMQTPGLIYGDNPTAGVELQPLQEMIVRATPYTLGGVFADRALSTATIEHVQSVARSLLVRPSEPSRIDLEPRARGVCCSAAQPGMQIAHVDVVVDAGGVVALRKAERTDARATNLVQTGWLRPLVEGAMLLLRELEAYGRAAIGLEIRGADRLYAALSPHQIAKLNPADLVGGDRLFVGGDLVAPPTSPDIDELVARWERELARAARLAAWEPRSKPPPSSDAVR